MTMKELINAGAQSVIKKLDEKFHNLFERLSDITDYHTRYEVICPGFDFSKIDSGYGKPWDRIIKSSQDIKVGDKIYLTDDYYFPFFLTVQERVFNANRNKMILVCDVVDGKYNDFFHDNYKYLTFIDDVTRLSNDEDIIVDARKKYEKEFDTEVCSWNNLTDKEKYYKIGMVITDKLCNNFFIDRINVGFLVMTELSKLYNFDWHRPRKFEFSED